MEIKTMENFKQKKIVMCVFIYIGIQVQPIFSTCHKGACWKHEDSHLQCTNEGELCLLEKLEIGL